MRYHDEPVGDPFRGAPYGEKLDPNTIGLNVTPSQGPAAALQTTGTLMGFVGNMGAAASARRAGEAQQTELNFQAAQAEQAAGQSIAASQRKAIDEKRRTQLVVSRGLAVAAASGGGASDPTVQNLLADITGEGAYRAGVALYQGEEQARQLNMSAKTKRFEGDVMAQGGRDAAQAYEMKAFGTALTGGASLYGKYGAGGPRKAAVSGPSSWLDAGSDGISDFG